MKLNPRFGSGIAGAAAGVLNGLLGTGGGTVLIPLLTRLAEPEESEVFPTSVAVILPVCLVSLAVSPWPEALSWAAVLPYLVGSAAGGLLAGTVGRKLPLPWIHRIFGGLLLMGGVRALC